MKKNELRVLNKYWGDFWDLNMKDIVQIIISMKISQLLLKYILLVLRNILILILIILENKNILEFRIS